jgi:hypothetical protein
VDLYIHFPIRLHGLVINRLSKGTILPTFTLLEVIGCYDGIVSTRREASATYTSSVTARQVCPVF